MSVVFLHAGLLPDWAELGVEGLNERAREAWALAGKGLWSVPKHSLFRNPASSRTASRLAPPRTSAVRK